MVSTDVHVAVARPHKVLKLAMASRWAAKHNAPLIVTVSSILNSRQLLMFHATELYIRTYTGKNANEHAVYGGTITSRKLLVCLTLVVARTQMID